jgi:hypothetical protein
LAVKLSRLDRKQHDLLLVGIAGVVGVGFGLYALLFPALGALYLTDGYHFSDPESKAIGGTLLVAVTAVIAAELVVSAAAIRMCVVGAWPGRRFFLGRPAAAIGVAAFALAAVIALLLS